MEAQDLMAAKVIDHEYGLSFSADPRFITSHDSFKWCMTSFNEYLHCKAKLGTEAPRCVYMYQKSLAICPLSQIEKWEEQIEEDRYPGYVPGRPDRTSIKIDYSKKH